MKRNWDYARALQELWNRSSYERGLISDPFGDVERAVRGLRRMSTLLRELGDPHLRAPAVHVAGSKGKGSTAALIAAAARGAGKRVGLYSSPHLHRFPERIAINGKPVPDSRFASVAESVFEAALVLESTAAELGSVTTFEFVTAMAFTAFSRADIELAVIEVGLGGLYDATNVLSPVVSVITRIDLEHTAVLGPTHADIAFQKAGIMRPGVPCVSSPQVAEAAVVIERAAAETGSPFQMGGRDWHWDGTWRSFSATGPWGTWTDLALGIPGPHQVENACTALAALNIVNEAGIDVPDAAIRAGLAGVRWPGRFERLTISARDVVFDGAHTPAAAAALVQTWRSEMGPSNATVVLGMGSDKDIDAFLAALHPIVGLLVVTQADSPRAADPIAIVEAAQRLGIRAVTQPSVKSAIDFATTTTPTPLLITGSLFVAGEGREALGLAAPDLEWRRLNNAVAPRAKAP